MRYDDWLRFCEFWREPVFGRFELPKTPVTDRHEFISLTAAILYKLFPRA